jgi:hypothetical protein
MERSKARSVPDNQKIFSSNNMGDKYWDGLRPVMREAVA